MFSCLHVQYACVWDIGSIDRYRKTAINKKCCTKAQNTNFNLFLQIVGSYISDSTAETSFWGDTMHNC